MTSQTVHFDDSSCEFLNEKNEIFIFGAREGRLYYLKFANTVGVLAIFLSKSKQSHLTVAK